MMLIMNRPTYDELIAALSESDHSNLRIKYGRVKVERDSLAAQVENLLESLAKCRHYANYSVGDTGALAIQMASIREVSNKALRLDLVKCLQEIKAQAGLAGFIYGASFVNELSGGIFSYDEIENAAESYASQIIQQEKPAGTWLKDSNTHCNAKAGE